MPRSRVIFKSVARLSTLKTDDVGFCTVGIVYKNFGTTPLADSASSCASKAEVDTAVVQLRAENVHASRAQAVHGALVSKLLHDHRITRFEENIINEIECLPRTRRHENDFGRC